MVKVKNSQKTIQDDDIKNKTTRLIVRLVQELAGKKNNKDEKI